MVTKHDYHEYGIENSKGTAININNLISLILYTDYTKLSTAITVTFRPKRPFESLE